MIFDSLTNLEQYTSLHPDIVKAFSYIISEKRSVIGSFKGKGVNSRLFVTGYQTMDLFGGRGCSSCVQRIRRWDYLKTICLPISGTEKALANRPLALRDAFRPYHYGTIYWTFIR